MPEKNIGIIGCGAIGTRLAMALESGSIVNASLVALFDTVDSSATRLKSKLRNSSPKIYSDFGKFLLGSSADVVVEAASQEAVRKYGKPIIESSRDLMVMSVGALVDRTFLSELLDIVAAKKGRCRIYVPTGAIAGVDAIRSVRHIIDSIVLTTTKSPTALAGAPFFEINKVSPRTITKPTVIYEGWTAEAVKMFPANINVAAVLGLAGVGVEKTRVRIIADPDATTNKHEIVATGSFGDIKITVNNVPIPGNPKSSFLSALSAIECLRSICDDGIRIGS